MKTSRNLRPPQIAVLLSLLMFSISSQECYGNDPNYSFGGLSFRLVEDRTHMRYPVPANKKVQVDLRSTLFLLFEPLKVSGESNEPSPKWEAVQDLLNDVNDFAKEYANLTKESVDISDSAAVTDFQNRVDSMRGKVVNELYPKAEKYAGTFGLTPKQFTGRLTGSAGIPGYKVGSDYVYENLAYFLKEQIRDLKEKARQIRQDKDGYEVTVIALYKQAGGATSRIHVDEYDNLPGGDTEAPRPLEQYGIRMTPEELRRFRMEVKASQDAANMIREIMENRDEIRSGVKRLRNQLKAQLENLIEQFGEDGLWKQALKNCMGQLETLEKDADTPEDVKAASRELYETLAAIEEDINAAKSIVDQAKELHGYLLKGSMINLFEIIAGESSMLNTLKELANKVEKLQILEKSKNYLDAITENAKVVGKHLATNAAIEQIEIYLKELPELPKTAAFLNFVSKYMNQVNKAVDAGDTLEDVADPIYYDIKNPPTATIDLDRYRNLERKDGIVVKVMFRAKETDGLKEIEHIEPYYLELEKLDLYTSVSASLIFARASSGTEQAKEWAPNVAAMVNWHKRNREPLNKGDEIWNWLNPGAGIHLASLDQGDDTVEFGIGVNLSFWNGLLNTGYGYNLSLPENREYFFVGLNLLHLLDVARGTASTPSWERGIDFE